MMRYMYYYLFLYEEIQLGEFKYLIYEFIYIRMINVNVLKKYILCIFLSKTKKLLYFSLYGNIYVQSRIHILRGKINKFLMNE